MVGRAFMIAVAAGLLAGPATAQVQQQQHQQMPDTGAMMAQMQAMMPMMTPGPSMILRMREALELTPQQVQRLERIRDSVEQAYEPHAEQAKTALREAASVLESETPDLSRYEAKLLEAANHHVLAHVSRTRGWLQAREVLTAEQRSNVEFGMKVMRQMMAEQVHEAMGGMRRGVTTDSTSTHRSPRW